MNLLKAMVKDTSKTQKDKIVKYVGNNADRFAELVKVYLAGPYRITQHAAWPLCYCMAKNPSLVRPHLTKLLAYAAKPNVHDAIKRNTVRLLQFINIPISLQGKTTDLCLAFLSNPKEPIAIRVFAMTVLSNLTLKNPELKNEIIPLIEDQLPYGSAGFRSRGMKVLKGLKGY